MGLADFEPYKQIIKHREKELLAVRGLSLDDLSVLIRAHMDGLNSLVELARVGGDFGTASFIIEALRIAPNVIFDAIALAADEPSYAVEARNLPVGLQVVTIKAILELTLEDIGGPKEIVALVQNMLRKSLPNQQAT